jgi:preprotein translocase subunit SecF
MRLFHSVNVDWIGKKWIYIGVSGSLFILSLFLLMGKGLRYGIDFRGGTMVYVKFKNPPQMDAIRSALRQKNLGESTIQQFGQASENEVIISLEKKDDSGGGDLEVGRQTIQETLGISVGQPVVQDGKTDVNGVGVARLESALSGVPGLAASLQKSGDTLQKLAQAIIDYRTSHGGLLKSLDEIKGIHPALTDVVASQMKNSFYAGEYTIINTEMVGAKVGSALRWQAIKATLYALAGMLVYIAWRFKGTVYGAAAVIAVFHDTIITLGFFIIFNREISLTVIAAILTLVGYSMNDTIVVFDRIRENLKLLRRETLTTIINKSINQTLSRTILTSGLTFITVLSLFVFGGEVINGFAFAMVIGIIIGTYSSIAVASPLIVMWYDFVEKRKKTSRAQTA